MAPLAGSAAINGGDPASVAGMGIVPLVDQRGAGYARVLGWRIDLGAVEVASGDFNYDGQVDGADFLNWQRQFGASSPLIGSGADGDGNGTVDGDDLGVWRGQFGEPNAAATVVAAPAIFEPAIVGGDDVTPNEVPSSPIAPRVNDGPAADSALTAIAQAKSGFRNSQSSSMPGRRVARAIQVLPSHAAATAGLRKEFCSRVSGNSTPRYGADAFFAELGEETDDDDFELIALSLVEPL